MDIKLIRGYDDVKLQYNLFGLDIQQNNYTLSLLSYFLNRVQPELIVEFGTRTGGLSIFLQLYALNKNSKFLTIDKVHEPHIPKYKDLFQKLDVDFRRVDLTDNNLQLELKELISKSNRTVLFCDAAKSLEFNLYVTFLKSGDVALCHDYFHDKEEFETHKNIIWPYWECKYSDIEEAIKENNMKYFMRDELFLSAWAAFIKS
jgi:cephalosporin hydroxylase